MFLPILIHDKSGSCLVANELFVRYRFSFRIFLGMNHLQGGVSIVRELHVYGSVVPVSARDPSKFQHQGFGQLLMEEAERIAKNEHYSKKLAVISGVGTRNYYRLVFSILFLGYFKSIWSLLDHSL